MTRRAARAHVPAEGALALAIRRGEYDRVALFLLIGFAEAARRLPAGTIDDVLAVLAADDDGHDDG